MDLRGAADYFKTRWKWRGEPEWYREAQAQRIERQRAAQARRQAKTDGTDGAEQPQNGPKNTNKTSEKPAKNTGKSQNTDNQTPREKAKAERQKAREQEVLNIYLQQILETLESVPRDEGVNRVRDSVLELLRSDDITPQNFLDFDKQLDELEAKRPEITTAIKQQRQSQRSGRNRDIWERVDQELKHLRDLERKGQALEFSGNLAGTAMGIMDVFLGPAGPLFKTARDLYSEYKDDAKGLFAKFARIPKYVRDKADVIRRAWRGRDTAFKRMFPKFASALDKFGSKLREAGGSILSKLPLGKGRLGKLAGAARAVGGFLSSELGQAATMLGVAGLFSLMGHGKKTDTPNGSDGKGDKEKPEDSPWSVESITSGLKPIATKVTSLWSDLTGWMGRSWNSITTWASSAWDGLVAGHQKAVLDAKIAKDYVEEKRDILWDSITGWFSELWDKIKGLIPDSVKRAGGWVKDKADAAVNAVKDTAVGRAAVKAGEGISTAAKSVSDALGGDGREKIGVAKPVDSSTAALGQKAVRVASGVDMAGLNPGLLQNFYAMVGEYNRATGRTVQVNSGARSKEQQAALRAANPGKAAPPGYSMHEYGLAIDINSREANEMEQMGLFQKYGFVRPVGGEPWHVEPMAIQGVKAAIRKGKADIDVQVAGGAKPNKDTEGVKTADKGAADKADAKVQQAGAGAAAVAQRQNPVAGSSPGAVSAAAGNVSNAATGAGQTTPATSASAAMLPPALQTAAASTDSMSVPLSQTLGSAITPQVAPYAAAKSGNPQIAAQTDNFPRVESQTKAIDTVAQMTTPKAETAHGNQGSTQIPTNKIGFYIGDMGMLTMNLGVGA